jgi:hypothetical protein
MTGLPAAQPGNSRASAHAPAQITEWPPDVPAPALVGNRAWARVIRQAQCTERSLDADEWFPVSSGAQEARREAAAAIAVCQACPVRSQCLALSLRHWDIGQHGVWGGMVAAERASLRRQMLAHRADALRYFTDAVGLPRDLEPQSLSRRSVRSQDAADSRRRQLRLGQEPGGRALGDQLGVILTCMRGDHDQRG